MGIAGVEIGFMASVGQDGNRWYDRVMTGTSLPGIRSPVRDQTADVAGVRTPTLRALDGGVGPERPRVLGRRENPLLTTLRP